jgi:hypothetical protein
MLSTPLDISVKHVPTVSPVPTMRAATSISKEMTVAVTIRAEDTKVTWNKTQDLRREIEFTISKIEIMQEK